METLNKWLKGDRLELLKKLGFFKSDTDLSFSPKLSADEMDRWVGLQVPVLTNWQDKHREAKAAADGIDGVPEKVHLYLLCQHVVGGRLKWEAKEDVAVNGANCAKAIKYKSDSSVFCKPALCALYLLLTFS